MHIVLVMTALKTVETVNIMCIWRWKTNIKRDVDDHNREATQIRARHKQIKNNNSSLFTQTPGFVETSERSALLSTPCSPPLSDASSVVTSIRNSSRKSERSLRQILHDSRNSGQRSLRDTTSEKIMLSQRLSTNSHSCSLKKATILL